MFAIWFGHLATVAVVLLFFFYGAKLKREDIISGIAQWRLHVTVLASTFILFPLITFALHFFMPDLLSKNLWAGFLFLALLPSTVQSSIVFTSIAGGNISAAIAAASVSQLIGIFLTPLMVAVFLGSSGARASFDSILSIVMIIFLPFIIGHLSRPWIGDWVAGNKRLIGYSDKAAILLVVFSAFCAATVNGIWSQVPPMIFVKILALSVIIFFLVLSGTFLAGRLAGFKIEDRIVVLFCGTKKSLVQGVPMARVLFPGPEQGLILLPVMMFHQFQLMACSVIAQHYGRRLEGVET